MADGNITIDTRLDRGNVNQELRALQREIKHMGNEMKLANAKAMMPFRKNLLETERNMYQLAGRMGNYTGTTQDFMNQVKQLGSEYKKTSDAMLNADTSMRVSLIQTAGAMMNMSTQSSKIAEGYTRMGNPLRMVNNGALAVTGALERMAHAGNATVLALKQLGPNASMKELQDEINKITAGQARFQAVALASVATSALVYGALHKAAMGASSAYKTAFENMATSVKQAFQPMVEVFTAVMTPIFNFIGAIAQMAIKFNEAHPVLAKVLQGIMMLVPALTLLLSPLAVGATMVNSFMAAWAVMAPMIMPLITGLAAISGTVWLVAAAIGVAVGAIVYFWKTNEGFRNAVIGAWDAIKAKAQELFGMLQPVIDSLVQKFNTLKSAIIAAFSGDFSQITAIFAQILPSIIAMLVGGIPGLIISASRFIPAIAQGITSNAGQLSATISNIVTAITTFLTTQLPVFIQQGVSIINSLVQGLVTALPIIVQALTNIITMIVPIITQMLPVLLQAGIQIIMALIQGIMTVLPVLLQTGLQLIQSLIQIIATNVPMILQAGIQIVMTLINGIVQILPQLINTAIQLIQTIIKAIADNLPTIIQSGIDIVLALVDGIIEILPDLIDAAILLIEEIVTVLVDNLPKIIDAGIEILLALIEGIIDVLPDLIDTIVDLIIKIVDVVAQNLPKIIDAGIKILTALIEGIIKILPDLIKCALDLVISIQKEIINNMPKILEAGAKLIIALIDGIESMISKLGTAIKESVIDPIEKKIKGVAKNALQWGKDIISGLISGLTSMVGSVMAKAGEIANGIKEKIEGAFKINSPSKWMRDRIVGSLYEGFDDGVDKNKSGFVQSAGNIASWMQGGLMDKLSAQISPVIAGVDGISNYNASTVGDTIIVQPGAVVLETRNLKELNHAADFFGNLRQTMRRL
ncbi:phage tail protein [Bacillus benzoevorans]|uniref:Phage-related protein n=1 Tax=Bacillus benzoevorans TaxID=1456 RepID=A0A7X0HT97_9BACI|nr:carbamoyl-phosphate synthase [Bacillus benzoevorans]MBB6446454.1 phage-related protein [Bacillus benzoevorans]